jgi:Cation transport ATPase (P-type)/E1-E2 ATPase
MTRTQTNQSTHKLDPFILSGSKVLEGIGIYLVTGVGIHSSYGNLMVSMVEETDPTPLQKKLSVVADQIATAGVTVALVLFVVLFSKFLAQLPGSTDSPYEKGQIFLRILISSLTVVVVAVPEGLPLAVTLALAIATTRMLKDNNLVRVLSACETMGNATSVCCDKTGTLTQNKMKVRAGILGTTSQFKDSTVATQAPRGESSPLALRPGLVSVNEFVSSLPDDVRKILIESIVINSTGFESEQGAQTTFVGSKTEAALLFFAKEQLGIGPLSRERDSVAKVQVIPFDSRRKCMASVTSNSKSSYRLYVKGAPEILLDKCTHVIADPTISADSVSLTGDKIDRLTETIGEYSASSLRTIGLAYREFQCWPPPGAHTLEGNPMEVLFEDIFEDMTFLGLFGIQDPLRPDVKEAVENCQRAGIYVRMVTGDNVGTARAIARECGILTSEGIVMEGPHFRALSPMELRQWIPRLQVLARSSPEDKMVLVKTLKELGEIVAVTGDGTNDGPALRAADVGFSMGISGTEVAKEASLIILMNDNFSSIVKAVEWGRTVNDAVRKFLQVSSSHFEPFKYVSADVYLVPTHCQYHCGHPYIRISNRQREGGIHPHASSIALDKPYHGHIRCSRTRHRPPNPRSSQPETNSKIRPLNHRTHVENDSRPVHLSARRHPRPQLRRRPYPRLLHRPRRRHAGDADFQHLRLDAILQPIQVRPSPSPCALYPLLANLNPAQQPPSGQQAQRLRRPAPKLLLHQHQPRHHSRPTPHHLLRRRRVIRNPSQWHTMGDFPHPRRPLSPHRRRHPPHPRRPHRPKLPQPRRPQPRRPHQHIVR